MALGIVSLIAGLVVLAFGAGVVGLSMILGADPQIWHLQQTAPAYILGVVLSTIAWAITEQIRGGHK